MITATLSVVVWFIRDDVRDLDVAGRTSEVGTCYAAARGRPALIVILRVIATGAAVSADERVIIDGFIDGYENNTPTVEECDRLARMRGFEPEDFPAPQIPTQRQEEREDALP